jgi:hypothetical protein
VILVVDAGSAKLLLDLRLVRKRAGDTSPLAFLASSLGSSEAAPPLTLMPMVSWAVFTTAGALDRQLPVPPSHLRPLLGVCVPVVVGVDAPSDAGGASEAAWLTALSCDVVLASSVPALGSVDALVVLAGLAVGASAVLSFVGAWVFGLTFLRGPIALKLLGRRYRPQGGY